MNTFIKLLLLAAFGFMLGSCTRCAVDMASAATLQSEKEATTVAISKFLQRFDKI